MWSGPVRMWFTPSSTLDENVLYQLVSPRSICWLRVSAVNETSTECPFSMTPASQSLPISRSASRPGISSKKGSNVMSS